MASFPKTAPIRLKGAKLTALRAQCFERDGYMCQYLESKVLPMGNRRIEKCLRIVVWESGLPHSGHMAHIKGRGRNGSDELSNVRTLCAQHHADEHNAGGKPVPAKEKR